MNNSIHFGLNIELGGEWKPETCTARHRLAVIVPYRNRLTNLNLFLYHMHPLLQRQQLAYRIFVVEQAGNEIFNKGILMNTAFTQALKVFNYSTNFSWYNKEITDNRLSLSYPFDCFVFHDVDLLPEGTLSHL